VVLSRELCAAQLLRNKVQLASSAAVVNLECMRVGVLASETGGARQLKNPAHSGVFQRLALAL
jgi:hypothetical protein